TPRLPALALHVALPSSASAEGDRCARRVRGVWHRRSTPTLGHAFATATVVARCPDAVPDLLCHAPRGSSEHAQGSAAASRRVPRSEEHTSELQSRENLV